MIEIVKVVGNFGGLVVLAGLFVWVFVKDKTKNDDMLARIDKTNENISKSIDAINKTTEVLKEYIIKHDERAKDINLNVKEILKKVGE